MASQALNNLATIRSLQISYEEGLFVQWFTKNI